MYICVASRDREPPCQDFFSQIYRYSMLTLKPSFSELRKPFLKLFWDLSDPVRGFRFPVSKRVFADVDFSNPESRDRSFQLSRGHFPAIYGGPEALKHIKSIYFWKVLVLKFSKTYTLVGNRCLWSLSTEGTSWIHLARLHSESDRIEHQTSNNFISLLRIAQN